VQALYEGDRREVGPTPRLLLEGLPKCGGGHEWREVARSQVVEACLLPDLPMVDRSERTLSLYRTAIERGCHPKTWRPELYALLHSKTGGLCVICREPVELGIKSGPLGHDHGPSVEHLVPWSLTADSSWSNLSLSHWVCNRDRGTKALG
jgi:hypothetical protein